jgi:hypothetical protein
MPSSCTASTEVENRPAQGAAPQPSRGAHKVCAINRAKLDKLRTVLFRDYRFLGRDAPWSKQKLAEDQNSSHIAYLSADD